MNDQFYIRNRQRKKTVLTINKLLFFWYNIEKTKRHKPLLEVFLYVTKKVHPV